MKEKVYEKVENLDLLIKRKAEERMKPWKEMVKERIRLPAKIETPRLSLQDRIGLWLQRTSPLKLDDTHSQDTSDLLLQVRCRFLTVLRSISTYYIFQPQEIEIREIHQSPSQGVAAGIVEVYHQGQLSIQSQWSLSLSGDVLNFEVTCPLAVFRQLIDLAWRNYPRIVI